MNRRLMAVEYGIFRQLQATRKELMAFARTLKTSEQMHAGVAEIMAAATILKTPVTAEEISKSYTVDSDGVAHIPVVGLLTPQADDSPCAAWSIGAETEYGYIIAATLAAEQDPHIVAIQYDMDSGGGYVDGVDQCAQVINACTKPTRAAIGNLCASACYWLASQCDEITVSTPAASIGSIGVACEEYDDSRALDAEGIDHRIYTSTDAPNKRPDTSTEEGQAQIIAELDATHQVFVSRVAHGRNVPTAYVNANFGRGGVLIAAEAQRVGMVDSVNGTELKNRKTPGVAGSAAQAASKNQEAQDMDISTLTIAELAKARPDLIEAAIKPAADQATSAERTRVAELEKQRGINAAVDEIVAEAIVTGATYAQVQPRIVAAATPKAPENPPEVPTGALQAPGGKNEQAEWGEALKAAAQKKRS